MIYSLTFPICCNKGAKKSTFSNRHASKHDHLLRRIVAIHYNHCNTILYYEWCTTINYYKWTFDFDGRNNNSEILNRWPLRPLPQCAAAVAQCVRVPPRQRKWRNPGGTPIPGRWWLEWVILGHFGSFRY